MRKPFFISIICLMAAAFAVAVVSCKKEKENTTQEAPTTEMAAADNMDEYLMAFKKKLLSAQKGDETLSIEQAQSDLGNLLNFDFGDANYASNVFHHDTLYTRLQLTDGQVDLSQLAVAYQVVYEQIKDAFRQVDLPDKTIYAIYCSIEGNNRDSDTEVVTVLTTRSYDESISWNTDDWRAGNKKGRCDGYMAGIYGAPERVMAMLNYNPSQFGCANGRVYFTDYTLAFIEPNVDNSYLYDANAPRQHRLFYEMDLLGNDLSLTCIPYEEQVYYYNQILTLPTTCANYFIPGPFPSDHVIIEYKDLRYQHSINGYYGWWKLDVQHAKLNCSPIIPDY